jgi:hypothetical protein
MNEPTETIELENQTVEIYQDEFSIDPREWDNLGIMAFFHGRYNLGDKHDFMGVREVVNGEYTYYDDHPDDFTKYLDDHKTIELPVYMYDHSGIGLSTDNSRYPFNCPWDSGMLGYIYVTYERVREEFGWKNLTKERIQKIRSYLQNELEVYDYFLRGSCYGYHLVCKDCGEELDTCWGFYGENWKENGLLDQLSGFTCVCQKAKVFQNLGMGL